MTETLMSQAKNVQNYASIAARHVHLLHEKIARKDSLEEHNIEALNKFYEKLAQYLNNISNLYESFMNHQILFGQNHKEKIGKVLWVIFFQEFFGYPNLLQKFHIC